MLLQIYYMSLIIDIQFLKVKGKKLEKFKIWLIIP